MRTIPLLILVAASCRAEGAFGTWKMDPARSTFVGDHAKAMTVRFEPHAKGEVFTVDSIDGNGRTITSSTILYLDDKPRDFQEVGCSGTQASRRTDHGTVEILRKCASGEWTRIVRRLPANGLGNLLILEMTEQQRNGRLERRLVLEKKLVVEKELWKQRMEKP